MIGEYEIIDTINNVGIVYFEEVSKTYFLMLDEQWQMSDDLTKMLYNFQREFEPIPEKFGMECKVATVIDDKIEGWCLSYPTRKPGNRDLYDHDIFDDAIDAYMEFFEESRLKNRETTACILINPDKLNVKLSDFLEDDSLELTINGHIGAYYKLKAYDSEESYYDWRYYKVTKKNVENGYPEESDYVDIDDDMIYKEIPATLEEIKEIFETGEIPIK